MGTSGLVDRKEFIRHLKAIAEGEGGHYEMERRKEVAATIGRLIEERRQQPQVLLEAPTSIVNQEIEDLAAGVSLAPGRITVEFDAPTQGLEKLLALAVAARNDYDVYERMIHKPPSSNMC